MSLQCVHTIYTLYTTITTSTMKACTRTEIISNLSSLCHLFSVSVCLCSLSLSLRLLFGRSTERNELKSIFRCHNFLQIKYVYATRHHVGRRAYGPLDRYLVRFVCGTALCRNVCVDPRQRYLDIIIFDYNSVFFRAKGLNKVRRMNEYY